MICSSRLRKRLSCKTFLIATVSPVSTIFASKTTPKEPLPMTASLFSLRVTPCKNEKTRKQAVDSHGP